jgi:hypothetical protein
VRAADRSIARPKLFGTVLEFREIGQRHGILLAQSGSPAQSELASCIDACVSTIALSFVARSDDRGPRDDHNAMIGSAEAA